VDATYQTQETVNGSANSSNDAAVAGLDGSITIKPGDRIPQIPHHIVKGFFEWEPVQRLFVDLSANAVSSSFARGNENNLQKPDGTYYIGTGITPGYAVVDLAAHYQVNKHVRLIAQINNLFDRHYYTGSALAVMGFTVQGTYLARPFPAVDGEFPLVHSTFYSPGAPRAITGGLRFSF
jgi:outer membrane receptor protein involved in Fe transport